MRIAIVYGTTEGQTQKICLFVQKVLLDTGHSAALLPAEAAKDVSAAEFDACILAASVHAGRYQKGLIDWATRNAAGLAGRPTLFLSVSLSAAGDRDEDWTELRGIAERFAKDTGWTPGRTEHVAGAFRFAEYDFFKSWAMRWIEAERDPGAKPGTDREYTDWPKLDAAVRDWTAAIAGGT